MFGRLGSRGCPSRFGLLRGRLWKGKSEVGLGALAVLPLLLLVLLLRVVLVDGVGSGRRRDLAGEDVPKPVVLFVLAGCDVGKLLAETGTIMTAVTAIATTITWVSLSPRWLRGLWDDNCYHHLHEQTEREGDVPMSGFCLISPRPGFFPAWAFAQSPSHCFKSARSLRDWLS